jgi:hypothetical protein
MAMREVAGAILVLAGSILIGAGMIAAALHGHGADLASILGIVVGLAGIAMMVSGPLRRAWDAIPTDTKPMDSTATQNKG